LSLTTQEARDLKLALEVRLHALRVELAWTDRKDYRAFVRERLDELESIAARLEPDADQAGHAAEP
jgi:hypothetical protein